MSKMNRSWSGFSGLNQSDFEALCPTNRYAVQPISSVPPGIIPNSLEPKLLPQVPIMATAINNCATAYVLNFPRIDNMEIDQDPLTLVFANGRLTASACRINHGDWHNRTSPSISAQVYQQDSNQFENVYSTSELPKQSSGTLQDLEVRSQKEALQKSIEPFLDLHEKTGY